MNTTAQHTSRRLRVRVDLLYRRLDSVRVALAKTMSEPERVNWIVLGPLLAVVAGIQLAMLRPPFPSDSLAYFGWAESLGGNEISHGTTRLAVLVPVRIAIELFGTSEAAYYIIPFTMSLVLIGSTYVVGVKITRSQFVGATAAMMIAVSVLVLELSSQILPDTFAAAWFVLGMALLLSARGSPRHTYWLVAGAAAIGLAYLSREYVILMAPLLLFVGWIDRWRLRDWGLICGVFVVTLVGEMALMVVLFDDPLARFKAIAGFAERGATGQSAMLVAYGEGATRWTVLSRAPGAFAATNVGTLLMLSVPGGLALALFDRRRRILWITLLIWIGALWVPMMLLAGILDPQTPRIRDGHVRYWYLIVPALYLLLVAGLGTLLSGLRNRKAAVVAGILAGAVVLGAVTSDLRNVRSGETFRALGATQWDEVRDWLRSNGSAVDRIYTDGRMARVLPLYTSEVFGDPIWDGEIVIFERAGEFIPTPELDGAVLLHELGLRYLRNRDLRVPESYVIPGPAWEVAVRRADGSLTIVVPSNRRQAMVEALSVIETLESRKLSPPDFEAAGDAVLGERGELVTTGPDPQIRFDENLTFGASEFLVVHMDTPVSTTAQLFWRNLDGAFSSDDSSRVSIAAGSPYFVIDLSVAPTDSVLRLDPTDAAGFVITEISLVRIGGM